MAVVCTRLSAIAMANNAYKADCSGLQEKTYKYTCNIANAKMQSNGVPNSVLDSYDAKAIEIELKLGTIATLKANNAFLSSVPNINIVCKAGFRKMSDSENTTQLGAPTNAPRFSLKRVLVAASFPENKKIKPSESEKKYNSLAAITNPSSVEKTFSLIGSTNKAKKDFPFDLKLVSISSTSYKVSLKPRFTDANNSKSSKLPAVTSTGNALSSQSNEIDCSYTFNN